MSESSNHLKSRLAQVEKHLTAFINPIKKQTSSPIPVNLLDKYRQLSQIDKNIFRQTIYGKYTEDRDRVLNLMAEDNDFIHPHKLELTRQESRDLAYRQLKKYFQIMNFSLEDYKKDPARYNAYGDALFCFDMGLATKFGVNFYLYLKTLLNFGSPKHQKFIDRVFQGRDLGCFALTELGHGSNAKDIMTTATYEHTTKQYVLNTPSDLAMKFWIGNGISANVGVVFAQLYIKEKCYGVHAFVVTLRDQYHDLYPGIVIGDCGEKIGLNAVDNAFMIFKNFKIPKENMLDRFSHISDQGEFITSIANPEKRFGMQLMSLSEGRIQVLSRSTTNLINCVTIATRFTAVRRQFGVHDKQESSILEYPSVQYRLLKHLSSCVIFKLAAQLLYDLWYENIAYLMDPENSLNAELHAIISVMKPLATSMTMQGIQECRELLGGFGYSQYNRIGFIRNDNDINLTWEGDNNVLIQQTGRFLLESFRHLTKGKKIPYNTLEFLEVNFVPKKCTLKNKKELIKTENIIKFYEYKLNMLMTLSMTALKDNLGKFPDMFDAWNHTQIFYLRNAAITYGELFVLKESFKSIKKVPHKMTRRTLKKLHDLWALNNLETNLNQLPDYFTNEQIFFIRESIMEICKDLKNEAVAIVDAIACSDRILGAPMGSSDGNIYLRFLYSVYSAPGCFEKPTYWQDFVKKEK